MTLVWPFWGVETKNRAQRRENNNNFDLFYFRWIDLKTTSALSILSSSLPTKTHLFIQIWIHNGIILNMCVCVPGYVFTEQRRVRRVELDVEGKLPVVAWRRRDVKSDLNVQWHHIWKPSEVFFTAGWECLAALVLACVRVWVNVNEENKCKTASKKTMLCKQIDKIRNEKQIILS